MHLNRISRLGTQSGFPRYLSYPHKSGGSPKYKEASNVYDGYRSS
jgi:hypothetical protein